MGNSGTVLAALFDPALAKLSAGMRMAGQCPRLGSDSSPIRSLPRTAGAPAPNLAAYADVLKVEDAWC